MCVIVKTKYFYSFTNNVNMTQKTWLPALCYLRHLQIFEKIDSFPKIEKVEYL